MLGKKAQPAEAALRKWLADPSGAVQVAAAEALVRLGKPEAALPVLERWVLSPDNGWFALQAANILDRLGEAARPALRSMKAAVALAGERNKGGRRLRRADPHARRERTGGPRARYRGSTLRGLVSVPKAVGWAE